MACKLISKFSTRVVTSSILEALAVLTTGLRYTIY